MAIGAAGLTAMLWVVALAQGGRERGGGRVVVTGAAGGVGSVGVAVLAGLGYEVHAATGRSAARDYLQGLGAAGFVGRAELAEASTRPLEPEKWAGGVDTVGSTTLATVLKQTRYGGSVAACGLAGGRRPPGPPLPVTPRRAGPPGGGSGKAPAPCPAAACRR